MKAQMLQNEMFDDGSFECFNFWVADCDGLYHVGPNDTLIQHLKPLILLAMQNGHRHLNTRKTGLVYGCNPVLEVQWS